MDEVSRLAVSQSKHVFHAHMKRLITPTSALTFLTRLTLRTGERSHTHIARPCLPNLGSHALLRSVRGTSASNVSFTTQTNALNYIAPSLLELCRPTRADHITQVSTLRPYRSPWPPRNQVVRVHRPHQRRKLAHRVRRPQAVLQSAREQGRNLILDQEVVQTQAAGYVSKGLSRICSALTSYRKHHVGRVKSPKRSSTLAMTMTRSHSSISPRLKLVSLHTLASRILAS
jgi:hypothetical protein